MGKKKPYKEKQYKLTREQKKRLTAEQLEYIKNPVCYNCIARQMNKYESVINEDGQRFDKFAVECSGIPNDYIGDRARSLLPPEDIKSFEILTDPVRWASEFIRFEKDNSPWVARWYQEQLVRCTAKRKVTRLGRRSGKTDSIAVDILYNCMTSEGIRCLIVTPQQSHFEEIMGRIRSFIDGHPALKASISYSRNHPYPEIKFHNGSRIRAFSAGTSSGSGAKGVRGQDADRVYLDEADYLGQSDVTAIMAILITTPETVLWASSTPTGRRDAFWRWCTQSPTYKEFHFPSFVIPHWHEQEHQFKIDYAGNPQGWQHEVLAEFGEQSVGVFQNKFIDLAKKDYSYESNYREPGWIYGLGADWNSEQGTEIVVTGYKNGRFKVVDALNIAKQEFTQLKGIDGIIAMNEKWMPDLIYLDQGYGATNIELIKKIGFDAQFSKPGSKKANLVKAKGYDFGSKVQIKDLVTGAPIRKDAKPFLVENAVRVFEQEMIDISAKDKVLVDMLSNYIIESVSPSGRPKYGTLDKKLGDHRLDALMLSLVGFKLELSDFGNHNPVTGISYIPSVNTYTPEGAIPERQEDKLQKKADRMPDSRAPKENTTEYVTLPGVARFSSETNKDYVPDEYMSTDREHEYYAKVKRRQAIKRLGGFGRAKGRKPKGRGIK